MSLVEKIRLMVEFDTVSTQQVWDIILSHLTDEQFRQEAPYSRGSVRNQMLHIAGAQRYWLDLMTYQAHPPALEDDPSLDTREKAHAAAMDIHRAFREYMLSLDEAGLEQIAPTTGEGAWAVVLHMVNHATDHRAQALGMLHAMGAPTFEQDLMDYVYKTRRFTKAQILRLIRESRAAWEVVLNSVPGERASEPIMGDWTIKDIVAHITWGEREMVGVLRAHALVGSDLWNLPTGERNQRMVEESRSRPLDEIIAEHHAVFRDLIAALEQLDDDDFNDPARIKDFPPDWRLWAMLEGNTWGHYPEHIGPVRAWLNEPRS